MVGRLELLFLLVKPLTVSSSAFDFSLEKLICHWLLIIFYCLF